MDTMDRRKFLINSAGVTAGMLAPAMITRAFGSPNDRIRVAVVGFNGQGGSHISSILKLKDQNVELAAFCDIDDAVVAKGLKRIGDNAKPAVYKDIRKLLEDKSIDAISMATPNHWHALGTIWACQAGKDVYVEKPASHNVVEGRRMVEAARKYKRIVQIGTQCRSSEALQEAVKHLRDGLIGDVYMARGLCFKWRDTTGRQPDGPVPAGVDYDLWTGPAPKRPFNPNRFHYKWHWHWDTGNGDHGNQGIHQMDLARWGLGVKLPVRAMSMGGHYMFDDDQETPNTQVSTLEFDEGGKKKMLVFEVRHWMTNNEAGISEGRKGSNTIGVTFYGSKGYLVIDSYSSYKTYLGKSQDPGPSGSKGGNHHANFFAAMRSRKAEELNADVEQGHYSAACMHLGNISYRTGRAINFDPATEKITGDAEASKLLTRQYRAPFVVPEKV